MSFSEETISRVWEKGRPVDGLSPEFVRVDDFGYVILRHEYGNRDSKYGWEIDHIGLRWLGGSDDIWNLRPLHWRPNAARQPRSRLFQAENSDYRSGPAGDGIWDATPSHERPAWLGTEPNPWAKDRCSSIGSAGSPWLGHQSGTPVHQASMFKGSGAKASEQPWPQWNSEGLEPKSSKDENLIGKVLAKILGLGS